MRKSTFDTHQLTVCVTLARTLNMGLAAKELAMTTSGVSHCLKTLEEDLGCRLFERNSRRFALSQAGRQFTAEAQQILDQMKAVRSKIGDWTDWRRGQLRIGASGTACQFILPPTLREFRESFPGFAIKIEQCPADQALSMLANEQLDLVLSTSPGGHASLDALAIGSDDLQFYVHPLHPWAIQRKAAREDIPNQKLILEERGGATFALIEAYFREDGIRIHPFIEIANEQAIKEFIRLDMGVGILPRWLVSEDVADGLLVGLPLGRRRLKRDWNISFSKTRRRTFAESLFINLCRSVFTGLVSETNA